MNISSIFGNKKQIKSFAEQLAEVKNIFKTSYDQAMALNAAIAEDIKYDHLAKDSDFIEVTEWANGEGWDICLNDKLISLTYGQLEAIKYLVKTLDYNR